MQRSYPKGSRSPAVRYPNTYVERPWAGECCVRFNEKMADVIANATVAKRRPGKLYSCEFEIEMDYVPYTVLAEGDTYEELLEDAEYNYKHSDDGTKYLDIGNLPSKKYDEVCQRLASEVAAANEHAIEARRDR